MRAAASSQAGQGCRRRRGHQSERSARQDRCINHIVAALDASTSPHRSMQPAARLDSRVDCAQVKIKEKSRNRPRAPDGIVDKKRQEKAAAAEGPSRGQARGRATSPCPRTPGAAKSSESRKKNNTRRAAPHRHQQPPRRRRASRCGQRLGRRAPRSRPSPRPARSPWPRVPRAPTRRNPATAAF